MLENIRRKFSLVPSQMMEDIFSHLVLIELSSSGTLEGNVDIQFKITIIMIGSQRLDISPLAARAQLLDISLPLLVGMDILKSGTIKPSTLRIASRLTKLTLTVWLFLQEVISS